MTATSDLFARETADQGLSDNRKGLDELEAEDAAAKAAERAKRLTLDELDIAAQQ
jgi:hypothetical protein